VSLAPYADLLRRPGVLRLVLVALVARIPHAATGVVVTLHVVGALGKGYAQAGLVAAAMTIGMAIGAPWRGRRVDSWGVRRALLPSVIIEAAVWVVAPFLGYEALPGPLSSPGCSSCRSSRSCASPWECSCRSASSAPRTRSTRWEPS
jgi:MFS family permease